MASYASGYPFCQKRLVGALPNPLPVAEVPSAAARFANAFSATAICLVHVQGRTCTKCKKKRVRFKGFTLSFPHFYRMCSTEHPKRSPEPAFRLCRMCASKIFQSVPKNAILIRLQDKKKSLAKISDLWHNGSRTISDLQECRTHTIRKVMKMESSHTDAPYLFQISSYDISRLLPQVSKALEKRSEYPLSQNVAIY